MYVLHIGGINDVPSAVVSPQVCSVSPDSVNPASHEYVAFVPFSDISILPLLGEENVEHTENTK